jgi:hypothetical protein
VAIISKRPLFLNLAAIEVTGGNRQSIVMNTPSLRQNFLKGELGLKPHRHHSEEEKKVLMRKLKAGTAGRKG